MAARVTLLDEALTLPPKERAELAAKLLESLGAEDDNARLSSAWEQEIRARVARVVSGEATGIAWSEVRDRLARRIGQP